MAILETVIFIRANTSISWPGDNLLNDPNDPYLTANIESNTVISEDQLTRTTTRTWIDSNTYVTCLSYSNTQHNVLWLESVVVPGMTFKKTTIAT